MPREAGDGRDLQLGFEVGLKPDGARIVFRRASAA